MAEEVKRIRAVFEADVSKYNTSLDGINKQMKLARAETRLAQKELEGFGTSSTTVAKVQDKLNQQIELNRKKIELFSQSLSKSQQTIETNVKAREELNQTIIEAKEALAKAEKAHGKESEAVQEAKAALESAEKAYNKNESAIKSNIQRVAEYESQIVSAQTEIQGLENRIQSQNQKLQEQSNKLKQAYERLDRFGDKAKATGEVISQASDKVLGISASMATLIGASATMSMSFEKNIASINTLLDDTTNLDKYKNKILELSDQTGISIDTVSDGMYQIISTVGDLGDDINQIFETMTKSAKAGGAEVADAVSLISAGMKGYGQVNDETARKISDLAFQTDKLGVTTLPEMASSMQALFPLTSTLNISLEELFGQMATLTGVTGNTAEVSTQLKAVFSNLIKPTTSMQKLMKKYGYANAQAMLETEGFAGLLEILQKETGGSSDKMGELFSSTEALIAILALSGEQYENFISNSAQMSEAAGTTNEALNKIESTKADQLQRSLNELKNSFLDLGGAAIPMVEKLIKVVDKVTTVIKDMDEETLDSIVNMTAMGLAVGGAGKVIGGTISTVGNLSKGLSSVISWASKFGGAASAAGTAASVAGGATGMGALTASLGTLVGAAAPWLLAGAAIVGTGAAIHHGMSQEVIPTVDLFADHLEATGTVMTQYGEVTTYTTQKISEETQKQVQAYLDLDEGATSALSHLYYSSETLTAETVASMTAQYQQMGETITQELQADKENDLAILNEFMANSQTLTEEQQAEMLRLTQEHYVAQETTVAEAQARIKEILETASKEKRDLTAEEFQEITTLQQTMKTEAISALSEQEAEAQVILDRMTAYDKRVTAEMVSENIKQFNEQEQKAIDAANSQYREVVNIAEKLRADGTEESKKMADEMIAEAERQRDETIEAAKETRDEAVSKIFEMNKDLIEDVDSTTGEIVSFWDKLFGKWDKWEPKKKTLITENKTIETTQKRTNYYSTNRPGETISPVNLERQVYQQLSRAIPQQLSFAQRHTAIQRANQSSINLTPQFEGIVNFVLDDGSIVKKNIKFVNKEFRRTSRTLSYGGVG